MLVSIAMIGTAVVLWAGAASLMAYRLALPPFFAAGDGDLLAASAKARAAQARVGADPKADSGAPYEEVRIAFDDQASVQAWFVPARRGFAVLLIPPAGASKRAMLPYLRFIHPAGFPVLMIDSPDYGSRRDGWGFAGRGVVKGAVAALQARNYPIIAALGVSEGGAAALLAQAQDPMLRAVVSDSSYANLGAMLRGSPSLAGLNPAFLRTALLEFGLMLGLQPDSISPENAAAKIGACAILIIQNSGDPITPASAGRAIYRRSVARDRELWVAPSNGHGDAIYEAPDEYAKRVLDFLERNSAGATGG